MAHHRALIAHANGSDAEALELLLAAAAMRSPAVLERGDPAFDAAWLCLSTGNVERAQSILADLGDLVPTAVANDYGPALNTVAGLS